MGVIISLGMTMTLTTIVSPSATPLPLISSSTQAPPPSSYFIASTAVTHCAPGQCIVEGPACSFAFIQYFIEFSPSPIQGYITGRSSSTCLQGPKALKNIIPSTQTLTKESLMRSCHITVSRTTMDLAHCTKRTRLVKVGSRRYC